ncbi:hypothetical protein ABB55_18240 [Prosthecomicrobium hirschii]|uniref:tRNA-splicing ligase RtcB n=1 Tax=Prosthecodimorpha hirschii TaxID=665126 RepID=A0A0P6W5X9_9HYPH|nr:RtcB family protein [Prosthecomicrobium hirschii]KPL53910.1 hypothetical protein ABB55_18240 [Prosthecomicrobium hirschii]
MPVIERLDAVRSLVDCGHGVVATLFADARVEIDRASLDDIAGFAETTATAARLVEAGTLDPGSGLGRIVLTPDFHRGAAMPVGTVAETRGFVIPRAAGSDIGCGMSLAVLDIEADEIAALGRPLEAALRHAFFEGGRNIRLDAATREAVLVEGLAGLSASARETGLFDRLGAAGLARAAARCHGGGRIAGARVGDVLSEWLRPGGRDGVTRDGFLGTVGGGNHFVEIQRVETIVDRRAAWDWGVRPGRAAVMVHSGSLGLGKAVALAHLDRALALWPAGERRPANGILPLALTAEGGGPGGDYLADMAAAANFAIVNRLAMSLMVAETLSRLVGRAIGWHLVHDLPHNLVWGQGHRALHRKGACPALYDAADPVFPDGHPVIVPGSMGTASWLLRGLGSAESLESAPHGAGRVLSRNAGRAAPEDPRPIRVVGKIDLERSRRDVAAEAARTLSEEAPRVYKDIGPVVDTVADAGIAARVARLAPLLTVKG